jgi:hypothetical protein
MGADTKLLAWVGGEFFMRHMEAEGFRVLRIPLTGPEALSWEDICARCGQAPDAVVYTDRSLPPPLLGLERYPALTAFYCIDSHIHGWYPLYAGAFDLCAVSLKDEVERFAAELSPGRVLWLPPFAEDRYQPRPTAQEAEGEGAGKDFDLLFVGTVDPETTPQRSAFLQRLGREFPGLAVRRGDFAELLPRARVALNIAERGDLNFRVFEALACGACLLTPKIGNGQDELFEDGVHFVTYRADDEADAAAKARALLADDDRREAYARAGFARVDGAHRPRHRASALAALLRQGFDEGLPVARLARPDRARIADLRLLFLHWADHCGDASLAARYLAEARRLSLSAS